MDDTVKLIVEIPKEVKADIDNGVIRQNIDKIYLALANGTPLDSIRAEIVALPKTYPFINHIDTYVKEDDVLQILGNLGKESEGEMRKDEFPVVDKFVKDSINEVLDEIKGYVDHIRNTGMGKKKSLEFIEKYIDGLKAESEISK